MAYTLLMGHNISDGIGDAMHVLNVWSWYIDIQKIRKDLPQLVVCISGDKLDKFLVEALDMQLINYDKTNLNNLLLLDIIKDVMQQNPNLILCSNIYVENAINNEITLEVNDFYRALGLIIDDVTHGFEMSNVKLSKAIWNQSEYGDKNAKKIIKKIEELTQANKFYRYLEFNPLSGRMHHSIEKVLTSDDTDWFPEENSCFINYLTTQANTIKSMGVGYDGVLGIESTGIPLRFVKKDEDIKSKALQEIQDSILIESFKRFGYIKGQNETEFLSANLLVPGYLQGSDHIGYYHYFKTIFESPIAKSYQRIIFIVNKVKNALMCSSDLPDNVFLYERFLPLEDYQKLLTIAQAFCISSGDNTFINALNYSLLPIVVYKNDKAFQLALMREYIKHKKLSNTLKLDKLCQWLDQYYSLTSEEPKTFNDLYKVISILKEALVAVSEEEEKEELKIKLIVQEKVLDEFISHLSLELHAQWIDFIQHLNKEENLFDKIIAIITDEAYILDEQYIGNIYEEKESFYY